MTFKDRLIQLGPRDVSGSRSSDRFVYQQTWALCQLLLLHQEGSDYVMTFDHHEDVSVIDSEADPKAMTAFQIKTANTNWTINRLLKQEAGEGKDSKPLPSILGKLHDLKCKFPGEVAKLAFVSNTSVSVRLKPDGKKFTDREKTVFEALYPEDQKVITDALKAEASLNDEPLLAGLIEFIKSDIPVSGHDTYGKGKLVEFLNVLLPKKAFQVNTLFKSLLSEVAARNNNQDVIDSFDDFLRHKSLSRRRFAEILDQAGVSDKSVEWAEVAVKLSGEQAPLAVIQGIRQQWDAVAIDRLARRDLPFTRLLQAVGTACALHRASKTLLELTDSAYIAVLPSLRKEWGFSESYVKTCIIVKSYELEQSETPSPRTPEEEPK